MQIRRWLLLGVALGSRVYAGESLTNSAAWNGTDFIDNWGGNSSGTPTTIGDFNSATWVLGCCTGEVDLAFTSAPEPATLGLVGLGLGAIGIYRRRR